MSEMVTAGDALRRAVHDARCWLQDAQRLGNVGRTDPILSEVNTMLFDAVQAYDKAHPTPDRVVEAARGFFAKAVVYGDDGQFQVTAWHPEAMDAARALYDLVMTPTEAELIARHASPVDGAAGGGRNVNG